MSELLKAAEWMLEWIDAVPKDISLPAMPGFDRDWVEEVLYAVKLSEANQKETAK